MTVAQNQINQTVDLYRYKTKRLCYSPVDGVHTSEDDGQAPCERPQYCSEPQDGSLYELWRQLRTGGSWEDLGAVCIGTREGLDVEGGRVTTEMVARAYATLDWPAATLTIQPTGGETLVNLRTLFSTTSTEPVTQTITLLGQPVTIEATPTSFTWTWDTSARAHPEDARPTTTKHGGTPYPKSGGTVPDDAITHRYTRADTTVRPRLDVTYSGRFRVGDGAWQDIPETRTITGAPQQLTVLEARPTLVR
ncbi:hypothetical protein [Nocardioides campestrisoli]|uniref:hypothetical protein n=1 Tax=Nocardioides campestrisoli TaxID=2736757 RepID=UPI0015E7DED2|nr:hypothetical protein [Nocardioides campestrisoli]